jgi:hypothetical protein
MEVRKMALVVDQVVAAVRMAQQAVLAAQERTHKVFVVAIYQPRVLRHIPQAAAAALVLLVQRNQESTVVTAAQA